MAFTMRTWPRNPSPSISKRPGKLPDCRSSTSLAWPASPNVRLVRGSSQRVVERALGHPFPRAPDGASDRVSNWSFLPSSKGCSDPRLNGSIRGNAWEWVRRPPIPPSSEGGLEAWRMGQSMGTAVDRGPLFPLASEGRS
jgi:hypothetical protein